MSDNPCTFPCCGCTSNRACEMLTTATAKTGIVPSGQPLADTITQLRADLARVTGERDSLRRKMSAERQKLSGLPSTFMPANAYSDGEWIVVLGDPDDSHNCDDMGCGQSHVIYRAKMKQPTPPTGG